MVNTSSIPAELRNTPQWVLWKYEDVKGNRTKVLYNPQNFRARSTGSNTWVTFDRAYKRYYNALTQKDTEDVEVIRYDGLGFVLSEEDDFVAWDFDHCVENGKVAEPAASYIKRLNSYTEISPSGTGIRVLTRGKLPPHGRKKGPFETYESKRFITITGNHLPGTSEEIQSRPQEILALHLDIFGDAPAPVVAGPYIGSPAIAEDESLIEIAKASKNGWKFTAMFDHGDISEFPSKSEARMALCGTLAFYAGPNPERIDRLFRQSALFDEKWDSTRGNSTYGADTIIKALEGRTEFFGTKPVEVGEISGTVNGIPFWTKDGSTLTTVMSGTGKNAEPVDQIFANFDLRICGLLKKADTDRVIWRGLLTCDGETIEIELDPDSVNNAGDLSKIKNWPTDATVVIPRLWALYRGWLSQTKTSKTMIEEKCNYGFHDVRSGKPTLLIPGHKHPKYLWRNSGEGRDPAAREMFSTTDDPGTVERYLAELRDNLPGIHETRYMFTALGWLSACSLAPFLREHQKGFPTLMISGLHGAGKSTLIEGLSPHFGVSGTRSSARTSLASISRLLSSNNIIPLIMDEYRVDDNYRSSAIEAIMRDCWDEQSFSLVAKTGSVETGVYTAPFALIGQNHIADPAALDRTVSIRLDRKFMDSLKLDAVLEAKAVDRLSWLQNPKNDGILGRALIAWIVENPDCVADLIELAETLVKKHSNLKDRRFKSYVAITAGLLLLVQLYESYGVKKHGWLSDILFMPAILSADTQLERGKQLDTMTMQDLFNITDKGILNSKLRGMSLVGTTLVFDIDLSSQKYSCPRYVYFDARRWYSTLLQEYAKKGLINLQDEETFYSMLEDQTRQDNSAIVSFGESYGSFRKNCVKVDLDKIIEEYSINAEGWNPESDPSEDY